jgi:hypothetical protein
MKDYLIRVDGETTKQDVAYDLIYIDGDLGKDHGTVAPQAINQLGFQVSLERCTVQLPNGVVVSLAFFSDSEHLEPLERR